MIRLALFLIAVSSAAAHAEAPRHIAAEYAITMAGVKIGHVAETYERTGDAYAIQSVTRAEGPLKVFLDDQVTLRSNGRVGAAGLAPEHFEQRQARDAKHDVDATFDWKRGVLVSAFGGKTRELPLPAQTQDRLSLMYQFMYLAPGSGPMTVAMSNGRKVEQYAYRFVGEEKVSTPAGEFEALHYARVNENPAERRADVWLAKARSNFPVRVVFEDPRGIKLEQALLTLQLD
jgi:hypothetical protein